MREEAKQANAEGARKDRTSRSMIMKIKGTGHMRERHVLGISMARPTEKGKPMVGTIGGRLVLNSWWDPKVEKDIGGN